MKKFRELNPVGIWVYCQICKRCYLTGEEIVIENDVCCAYEDCRDGDFYDAVNWQWLRRKHPSLPEQPERKVRYLLSDYPREK